MEKFKFVDLGEDAGGVYPVIANSDLLTTNSIGDECRFIIGVDKEDGQIFFSNPSNKSAGNGPESLSYPCFSSYVSIGNKSNYKKITASLRSLADELEKTLDVTQS